MSTRIVLLGALLCASALIGVSARAASNLGVIPAPVKMEETGDAFTLDGQTRILFQDGNGEAEKTAEWLAAALRQATGYALNVASDAGSANAQGAIHLKVEGDASGLNAESYRLNVNAEGIAITAPAAAGLFYGGQTLRQLLPPSIFCATRVDGQSWKVPGVSVEDGPRFAWRGMLLDVARHFMPKEFVLKFIDTIALQKMNRLHLHLTDDQGWRIEIKKYPKLTEVGAWRTQTLTGHSGQKSAQYDGKRHGGFYTQDDIREMVAYAAERHVILMPEIEMPGHAQAAIAAYPELGNLDKPLPVKTEWGVNPNIFNAEESTILFLQDVLAEVLELFPSHYIHIGGDEAVKDQWKASKAVQARIAALGLKDEDEMQRYFISRMNDFLASKGRSLVGWDEILEGGLGQGPTVMAWRGIDKAVEAVRGGKDAVMAPTDFTYFDYYQGPKDKEPLAIGGDLRLEKAYSFEPLPEALDDAGKKRILGAQGQIWGEYIATPEHAEYMAFPRACALAEVVWSPKDKRNYKDFLARLPQHLARLGQLDVKYRALEP